jgi:uncharacterized protein (DUF433 family)
MTNLSKHIEIVPGKRFGRPILKGSRISVYDVLNWLANGMTKAEILEDFPELSEEKIQACLTYAAHKENKLQIKPLNLFSHNTDSKPVN